MQVIETLGIERPERAALPRESSSTLSATILNQARPEKVKRGPLPRVRPLRPRPADDDDDGDLCTEITIISSLMHTHTHTNGNGAPFFHG